MYTFPVSGRVSIVTTGTFWVFRVRQLRPDRCGVLRGHHDRLRAFTA